MIDKFPVYEAGHIFNKFNGTLPPSISLQFSEVEIEYPTRLDAMAIDPSAVAYNDEMIFTPGEVVISINKMIKVKIKVIKETGGELVISELTRRKVLAKHAYYLITKALGVGPSLEISVIDDDIPKHVGFGSSSSTISAVAVGINELYGNPIEKKDLIKYITGNHGEEVSNNNADLLKSVQSIGGGVTGGLSENGIIIIAGRAKTIAEIKYSSKVLIGIPKEFKEKSANELMELEEKNLWKFEKTGKEYSEKIAYDLLHKALPGLVDGDIHELAKVVFDYRFNMGSIENCSFVYEDMNNIAFKIRKLFEEGYCEFLSLSSVGPAFFVLVKDEDQEKICKQKMYELNMNIIEGEVYNDSYVCKLKNRIKENFWVKDSTEKEFKNKKPSEYITNVIDEILLEHNKEIKVLDVGCGAGRYSKYISGFINAVDAVDLHKEMSESLQEYKNINFKVADMDNLPFKNEEFDLILSIGVLHNAKTEEHFNKAVLEISRLLKSDRCAIISVFTNDLITSDLTKVDTNTYNILNREPMILLSKEDINSVFNKNNLKIERVVKEAITDVGGGKRNVYTIIAQKQ